MGKMVDYYLECSITTLRENSENTGTHPALEFYCIAFHKELVSDN